MIKVYRLLASPYFGFHCRFEPTCSVYAYHAIERHGAVKGLWLAIKRLFRCHPFANGGFDPVPPSNKQRR